jgi:hypothetical protein
LSYAVRATKTITITVARDISILLTPFASAWSKMKWNEDNEMNE